MRLCVNKQRFYYLEVDTDKSVGMVTYLRCHIYFLIDPLLKGPQTSIFTSPYNLSDYKRYIDIIRGGRKHAFQNNLIGVM